MIEIWYVALPRALLPSCSNEDHRVQDGLWPGVLGSNHRNILKNLLLQNHLAQMLEIGYVALPRALLPSCSNEDHRVQDGLWPGVLGSNHRNILKNLLLQNHLAQMLEIGYVALPSGLLPSLFK